MAPCAVRSGHSCRLKWTALPCFSHATSQLCSRSSVLVAGVPNEHGGPVCYLAARSALASSSIRLIKFTFLYPFVSACVLSDHALSGSPVSAARQRIGGRGCSRRATKGCEPRLPSSSKLAWDDAVVVLPDRVLTLSNHERQVHIVRGHRAAERPPTPPISAPSRRRGSAPPDLGERTAEAGPAPRGVPGVA
jgi:hypothetical protein